MVRDPEAAWRASLEEGMLKGSFVSELEIRLQLIVPSSPRVGGPGGKEQGILQSKGCRPREPAMLFSQLKTRCTVCPARHRKLRTVSQLPALPLLMTAP